MLIGVTQYLKVKGVRFDMTDIDEYTKAIRGLF